MRTRDADVIHTSFMKCRFCGKEVGGVNPIEALDQLKLHVRVRHTKIFNVISSALARDEWKLEQAYQIQNRGVTFNRGARPGKKSPWEE